MKKKVIDWDKLRNIRERTVVLAAGVFDILTVAHIKHLEWGAKQADILVVGLTPDEMVDKGRLRPCFKLRHRIQMISALTFVRHIVINRRYNYCEMIETLQPNFYLKGPDIRRKETLNFKLEKECLLRFGGRVLFSPGNIEFHTTEVLKHYDKEQLNEIE